MKPILFIIAIFVTLHVKAQEWKSLNTRALQLYKNGDFSKAIITADSALKAAQAKFGTVSSQYITSLSNKSYSQSKKGDLYDALDGFKLATNLSFELYRLPHIIQLEAVIEVSKVYAEIAKYDSAEYYVQLADYLTQGIIDNNPAHYDTASFEVGKAYIQLNANRAVILHRKGQVAQAIEVLELEKKSIESIYQEKASEQPEYSTLLNNLASYYNQIQNFGKSLEYAQLYQNLIATSDDILDQIHAYQNLASAYRLVESDSAVHFWNIALELLDGSQYEGQNIHAILLNNLAENALHLEDYSQSIKLLTRSLDYQNTRQVLRADLHKTTLFNLAEAFRWSDNYSQSDSIYRNLINDIIEDIAHNFTFLSDNEKMSFYDNHIDFINGFASLGLEISGLLPLQGSESPYISNDIFGRLYNLQLQTKAIILNASKRMKSSILSSGDTTLVKIYSLWENRKNQFAQALLNDNLSDDEFQNLKQKIEENERWLTSNSRSFQSGFVFDNTNWRDVQASLKPNEAAVEIIRLVDGLIYGALIVTPQTFEQPVMALVMSTRSKNLDDQFYDNYRNSISLQLEDTLSYATYWKPIKEKVIENMPNASLPDRVYFSNDGIYNQINLNTLFDHKASQYVLDETEIVIVTNTKELVKPSKNEFSKRAVLVGNPAFSLTNNTENNFSNLPGTMIEVNRIQKLLSKSDWHVSLYSNESAAEGKIKNISGASVVHLASHGFFKSTNQGQSLAETMIQSGIALAGANDIEKTKEDGLLTAFEVLNMNLDSTHLVVLSACETGLGASGQSEGVYGLQRAVRVAGANNIIMSLWKVDDSATQEMMFLFYEHWLTTDNMHAAFLFAQKELRKKYPQPYYWGAFILAGK